MTIPINQTKVGLPSGYICDKQHESLKVIVTEKSELKPNSSNSVLEFSPFKHRCCEKKLLTKVFSKSPETIFVYESEEECSICNKKSNKGRKYSEKIGVRDFSVFVCFECLEKIVLIPSKLGKKIKARITRKKQKKEEKNRAEIQLKRAEAKRKGILLEDCSTPVLAHKFVQQLSFKQKKERNKKRKICYTKPAPHVKCRLCGQIIKITKWRKHLERFHDISGNPKVKDFFISVHSDLKKAQKEWYNPNLPILSKQIDKYVCGTKINGGPKVKIIYNNIFSNRRKF